MKLHDSPIGLTPPADRVILIVADGLRADKLFEVESKITNQTRAPFLHQKSKEGTWGVSHSRVPTESRPGHVAMIAGFYEDLSAVTKGWKANPVEFDSSFHRAEGVYCWGSPDIVYLFNNEMKGSEHINSTSYNAEIEDFGREGSHLDTWVFQRFQETIEKSYKENELRAALHQKKTIFFLHLLGIDTNGHAHRPYAKEYLNNIKVVDSGVEQAFYMIENYFNDSKTAYIFTSDHGMSDIGNHGDGDPDNTETPLIVWGSGVANAKQQRGDQNRIISMSNKNELEWPIYSDKIRQDVHQADIAPLIASLLGTSYPMNSIGVLPVEYLNSRNDTKAKLLLTNVKQILEMLYRQEEIFSQSKLFFIPYDLHLIRSQLNKIESLIEHQQFEIAISECYILAEMTQEGLLYYQKYHFSSLLLTITLGYLGWFIFLIIKIFQDHQDRQDQHDSSSLLETSKLSSTFKGWMSRSRLFFAFIFVIISVKNIIENASALYYVYLIFPCFFWGEVFHHFSLVSSLIRRFLGNIVNLMIGLFLLIILETLVASFFERMILSVCVIALGVWGVVNYRSKESSMFLISCILMSIFPCLPINAPEYPLLLYLSSLLFAIYFIISHYQRGYRGMIISYIPYVILLLCVNISIYLTSMFRQSSLGLPLYLQLFNWVIFLGGISLPVIGNDSSRKNGKVQIYSIFYGFFVSFCILSIHYESLYFWSLGFGLLNWIELEMYINHHSQKNHRNDSNMKNSKIDYFQCFRVSVFYIILFFVAFFGTGNIASIGSFEISSTYRLVTVFRPFFMSAILLVKIFLPFIFVCTVFISITRFFGISEVTSFLMVILQCAVIALNFLFLVRDEGSWKEIGMSISHYIVACAFIILQLGLYFVSLIYLRSANFEISKLKSKSL